MRHFLIGFLIIFALLGFQKFAFAQSKNFYVLPCVIENGDTLMLVQLPEYIVYSQNFMTEKQRKAWYKLVYNVRRAYPYAKLAGEKLWQYNDILKAAKNQKERRKILKDLEDEIRDEFEMDLKGMTISQGKVLIKLIYRETGSASFYLVKDLRGAFTAFFFQSFARIFGYDLKTEYDPKKDWQIELVVQMIENGQLQAIAPNTSPKKPKKKSYGGL